MTYVGRYVTGGTVYRAEGQRIDVCLGWWCDVMLDWHRVAVGTRGQA